MSRPVAALHRAVSASLALVLASSVTAAADPVEDFYKGRQLRIVIGAEPGSDYDQWGRLLARHLGRYIPGRPQPIALNMPGAGQIIATNHIYNIADRDGSVIGLISRNLPYLAVTGDPNVRIDVLKLNWLGSPERAHRVCAVADRSPVHKAEELLEREVLFGGTGAGSGVNSMPTLVSRLLGLKLKLVEGYRSSPGVMLAIERGEVDGICVSIEAIRSARPEWLKTGRMRVLFNLEQEPLAGTGAPSVYRFATTERQRQILDVLNSGSDLGRPIIAPPGVPADRVAALRKAIADMLGDTEIRADAAKSGYEIELTSGEEITARLEKLMRTPREIVQAAEQMSR